jgi:hypothetical protein
MPVQSVMVIPVHFTESVQVIPVHFAEYDGIREIPEKGMSRASFEKIQGPLARRSYDTVGEWL